MAISVVQAGLVAVAGLLLGLLLRDVFRRRRVIPSLAAALLIVVTATPVSGSWSTAAFLISFPFLLATFPAGDFVPRAALWPVLGWAALGILFGATGGSVGRQAWWSPVVVAQLLLLGGQIHRYRRRTTIEERARTQWMVLFTTVCFAGLAVVFIVDGGRIGEGGGLSVGIAEVLGALPAFGFAVGLAAPGLLNVDAAMRGVLVILFSATLLAPGYLVTSLVARGLSASPEGAGWWGALAVAAGSVPVIRLAGRFADRVVYQGRPDPMRALADLGRRLETGLDPLRVPDTVVRTVRESLFLAGAELRASGVLAAKVGEVGATASTFPIVYQGECLAVLAASPRRGEAGLTAHDRQIVAHLARQAASALHGARAIAELVDARSKLVLAREEERRRLRRDRHDDLAPTLVGLGLGAAAIEHLARSGDPGSAEVAAELHAGIRAAARQVREIAYDLRPPVLDAAGLVAAIRDRLDAPADVRPRIEVRAHLQGGDELVEVAVRNSPPPAAGPPAVSPAADLSSTGGGRGLAGMRERVHRHGGQFQAGPDGEGGWDASARLPDASRCPPHERARRRGPDAGPDHSGGGRRSTAGPDRFPRHPQRRTRHHRGG